MRIDVTRLTHMQTQTRTARVLQRKSYIIPLYHIYIQHTLFGAIRSIPPAGTFAIPNGSNLVVFTYESYESYLEDMGPSKAIELDAVLIDCSNDEQVRKILPGCNGQNHVFEFARSWRVVVLPSSRGAAS